MNKTRLRPVDRKPGALYGTERSGYAREVVPERLEAAEKSGQTLPVASLSGRQEGVPSPAERVYAPGRYQIVDAEEAMRRLKARNQGKMDKIKDGLDYTATRSRSRPKPKPEAAVWQPLDEPPAEPQAEPQAAPAQPPPDPYDQEIIEVPDTDDPFTPGAYSERDDSTPKAKPRVPVPRPPFQTTTSNTVADKYLAQRERITLELSDTTLNVAAIDVITTRYGVTILLPLNPDGGTFIPKPGSELVITVRNTTIDCYFPGAYFEIPQLKLMGLSFIRKEEGA